MNNKILSQNKHEAIKTIKHRINKVISHYDSLIDENNDPTRDPKLLQEYMDKWDGRAFFDELELSPSKDVLEIGVGTGRLALKVCDKCKSFTGIDISPKTIERAKLNLKAYSNIELICSNFLEHNFDKQFDIVYSSLTFMHIREKLIAINKIVGLLKLNGRFILSVDKNQSEYIEFGDRKIRIYPDNPDKISENITAAELVLEKQFETEFAVVFVARKA